MNMSTWFGTQESTGSEPTLDLGISLAGAVSAGSYTAGVLNILCRALDQWQEQRMQNPAATPRHRIRLREVVGASAGSLNGALLAMSAQRNWHLPTQPASTAHCPFHKAWVEMLDIHELLGNDDLHESQPISLLNARALERLALQLRTQLGNCGLRTQPREWMAPHFRLSTLLTNLDGTTYRIPFSGHWHDQDAGHWLTTHQDRMDFAIHLLPRGEQPYSEPPYPPETRLLQHDLNHPEWQLLLRAALASAAHPLAFPPICLPRPAHDYHLRQLAWHDGRLSPFPPLSSDDEWLCPCMIDGGATNNEPLCLLRQRLLGHQPNAQAPGLDRFGNPYALLLIDPLPGWSAGAASGRFLPGRILTALVNSCRFNEFDADWALHGPAHTRFMITPDRNHNPLGSPQLATQLLGGFAGLFSQAFREHDYRLGQCNAWHFLRRHFVLPASHPLMTYGYAGLEHLDYQVSESGIACLPIIPMTGQLATQEPLRPSWPYAPDALEKIRPLLEARLDAVIDTVMGRAGTAGMGRITRLYLNLGLRLGRRQLKRRLMAYLEHAFKQHCDPGFSDP